MACGKRIGGRGNKEATPPDRYERCRDLGPRSPLNKFARHRYLRGVQIAVDAGKLHKITADLLRMMVEQWSGDTLKDVFPFHKTIAEKNRRSPRWSEYRLKEARDAGFIRAKHRSVSKENLWRSTSNLWRFETPAWVQVELDRRDELLKATKKKTEPTPKAPQNQRSGQRQEESRPQPPEFDQSEVEQRKADALKGEARRVQARRSKQAAAKGHSPPQK